MAKKLNDHYLNDRYDDYEEDYYDYADEGERNVAQEGNVRANVWAVLRPVVIFAISVVVVLFLVFFVVDYVREKYLEPVNMNDTSTVEVTIPRGASLSTISEVLYENGIVKNETVFKFYTDFTDMGSKLKAGTYELSPSMTFDDIIYTLRKGMNTSPTNMVTLMEGQAAEDFVGTLEEGEILTESNAGEYLRLCETGEDLTIVNNELKRVISENKTATEKRKYALEGYLFPDTYEFYRDSSPKEVLSKQLNRFNEVFPSTFYQRADEIGMTVDEVITLASIIQKEAQNHDFEKVSAVLHNRLNRDMPLQCDTTVAYGLDITDRLNLTTAELEAASPYNTYLRTGLPIGPICNPSAAAIEAALYPDEEFQDEGYLYFVLEDPNPDEEGKLHLAYAKTLEEHDALVAQYKPLWDEYDRQNAQGNG